MVAQKNILALAILAGIAGVIIGGVTIFLSLTNVIKP
jgi:hypothetical protein